MRGRALGRDAYDHGRDVVAGAPDEGRVHEVLCDLLGCAVALAAALEDLEGPTHDLLIVFHEIFVDIPQAQHPSSIESEFVFLTPEPGHDPTHDVLVDVVG